MIVFSHNIFAGHYVKRATRKKGSAYWEKTSVLSAGSKSSQVKMKIIMLNLLSHSTSRDVVEENEYLKFKGEVFHAYHFNCHCCGFEKLHCPIVFK